MDTINKIDGTNVGCLNYKIAYSQIVKHKNACLKPYY